MKNSITLSLIFWTLSMAASWAGEKPSVAEVAKAYMWAFEFRDLEKIQAFYTEETVFEDPTSGFVHKGAKAIHEAQKQWFRFDSENRFEVENHWVSGDLAIFQGTFYSRGMVGMFTPKREDLRFRWKFVTILKIAEGKVIRHTDYLDVESFQRQMKAQGVRFAPPD